MRESGAKGGEGGTSKSKNVQVLPQNNLPNASQGGRNWHEMRRKSGKKGAPKRRKVVRSGKKLRLQLTKVKKLANLKGLKW